MKKYLISQNKLKIVYCLNYYLNFDMHFLKEVILVFVIKFKLKITFVKINQ